MVDIFRGRQKNLKVFLARLKNFDSNKKTSAEVIKSDSNSSKSKDDGQFMDTVEESDQENEQSND